MKPLLVEQAPDGDGWVHEIKHDGYRTLLAIEPEEVRAFSSSGHDWSNQYRRICNAAGQLYVGSALIDGELVVQDDRGVSDFEGLRGAIAREPHRLVFFAFDLLHLNGEDLRGVRLDERRGLLRELLGMPDPLSPIQFSEAIEGRGPDVFAAAERMGLEGIVSKRASSHYRSGPAKAWAKTKATTIGEFVLIGSKLEGKVPTLLLARETATGLVYAGSAFLAMSDPMREVLRTTCERIKIARPAVEARLSGAWWFRPELRIRVKHLRSEGGMLRHASALGIAP